MKPRMYKSFEEFLNSDSESIDLLNVQLPGVVLPLNNTSDIICQALMV